jgi:TonB-dependent starch-binding outer membrane protein SusC
MRKSALLVLCLFVAVLQLMAQTKSLGGKVTDEKGAPLEGVTVTVKGTQVASTTKTDGTFTINAPQNARILVFSFVGPG